MPQEVINEMFNVVRKPTLEDVRNYIQVCEGNAIMQTSYSSYHDTLTVVDFTNGKVITNLKQGLDLDGNNVVMSDVKIGGSQ